MIDRARTLEHVHDFAQELELDPHILVALIEVEAPGGGFLDGGHPRILYERHLFHRFTRGRFSSDHPDLSNAVPSKLGSYGTYHDQVRKLAQASLLDCSAAHRACSWGAFQILGENYYHTGHPSLWSFIAAMFHGEVAQYEAGIRFIASDHRQLQALRAEDFGAFSRLYNGPGYQKTGHHRKLREALRQIRRTQVS